MKVIIFILVIGVAVVALLVIKNVFGFQKLNLHITKCVRTGCSGQLCLSEEQAKTGGITTCEFNTQYGCYNEAKCEAQKDGECGWTQTVELTACLTAATKIKNE